MVLIRQAMYINPKKEGNLYLFLFLRVGETKTRKQNFLGGIEIKFRKNGGGSVNLLGGFEKKMIGFIIGCRENITDVDLKITTSTSLS